MKKQLKKMVHSAVTRSLYRAIDKFDASHRLLINVFNSGIIIDSRKVVPYIKRYFKATK